MWPAETSSAAHGMAQSGDASPDDVSDAESDSSDDFSVLVNADPNERTRRLHRLSEVGKRSNSPADVAALVRDAQALRSIAATHHPITSATRFSKEFVPADDNFKSNFSLLGQAVVQCEDAARAWQAAADHYQAAVEVASKISLPVRDIARLNEAVEECDAHVARLDIKGDVLRGILCVKREQTPFGEGYVRALELTIEPLRRALARCGTEELAALPLHDAPIEGLDVELRNIGASAHDLSTAIHRLAQEPAAPPPHDPSVEGMDVELPGVDADGRAPPPATKRRVTALLKASPNQREALRARLLARCAELEKLTGDLTLALRGEFVQAPVVEAVVEAVVETVAEAVAETVAEPIAPEQEAAVEAVMAEPPEVARLVALQTGLAPLLARAEGATLSASANHEAAAQSVDGALEAIVAWHDAAEAYDDAAHTFDSATAEWSPEARETPEPQALHAQIRQGRATAIMQMQTAVGAAFATLWRDIPQVLTGSRGGIGIGEPRAMTGGSAEPFIEDLAGRCRALLALAEDSAFLRRATDIDVERLSTPFAALADFLDATKNRPADMHRLMSTADRIQQAAGLARGALTNAASALNDTLRAFLNLCSALRTELIRAAYATQQADVKSLCVRVATERQSGAARLQDILGELPDLLRDDAPASAVANPGDDAQFIGLARALASQVDAYRETVLQLPPDAPETMVHERANTVLMLSGLAMSCRLTADLTECYGEAREAIGNAPLSRRAKVTHGFAERARAAGVNAGAVLGQCATLRLDLGAGTADQLAQILGSLASRSERQAECMRLSFDVLGRFADMHNRVHNLAGRPARDAGSYKFQSDALVSLNEDTVGKIREVHGRLTEQIDASKDQPGMAGGARVEQHVVDQLANSLEWRATLEVDTAQRQWMRVTLDALKAVVMDTGSNLPEDANDLLDLLNEDLSVSTQGLLYYATETGDKDRCRALMQENVALGRGVQQCREQLESRQEAQRARHAAREAAAQQPSAAAGPSQPGKRKGNKGKAKRK